MQKGKGTTVSKYSELKTLYEMAEKNTNSFIQQKYHTDIWTSGMSPARGTPLVVVRPRTCHVTKFDMPTYCISGAAGDTGQVVSASGDPVSFVRRPICYSRRLSRYEGGRNYRLSHARTYPWSRFLNWISLAALTG